MPEVRKSVPIPARRLGVGKSGAWSEPVIYDGVIYFETERGPLAAVDIRTGKELWVASIGLHGHTTLTATKEVIYTAGGYDVQAIDRKTGKRIWSYDNGEGVGTGVAEVGDKVYVGCYDNYLYTLNSYGNVVQRFKVSGILHNTPTVQGDMVYFSAGSVLYAINAKTDEVVWEYYAPRYFGNQPTIEDGMLYIGDVEGIVHVIDTTSGKGLQKIYTPKAKTLFSIPISTPVFVNENTSYFADKDGTVFAVDSRTYEILWQTATEPYAKSLILGDGVLYLGTDEGHIYAISTQTGQEQYRLVFDSGCNSVLYDKDVLCVKTDRGDIYGVGV